MQQARRVTRVALEEDAHCNNGSDRHRGPQSRFCAERVSPMSFPPRTRSACAPGAADGSSVYATGVCVRHCAIRAAHEPGTPPRPALSWPIHARLRRPLTSTTHGCTKRLAPEQSPKSAVLERGTSRSPSPRPIGNTYRRLEDPRGYFRSGSSAPREAPACAPRSGSSDSRAGGATPATSRYFAAPDGVGS